MGIDPATISPTALVRIILILLYVSLGGLVIWRLYPRLSSSFKVLASGMLVAQIILIALSLELQIPFEYAWIIHVDREWNIPTTIASAQLALVAAVAMATAWLAKDRPLWHRIYLGATAALFLYLARDELFIVHEAMPNWRTIYAAVGAFYAIATFAVAESSPRSARIWHICLVAGLAMTAFGAIALDHVRHVEDCLGFRAAPATGCRLSILEEALEFLGIWIALIGLLGQFSESVTSPAPLVRKLLLAFPLLWILVHPPLLPFLEYRFTAQPAGVKFEENISLKGYRIDRADDSITLVFFTQAASWRKHGKLGYSVHLIDQQTGESVAGANALVNPNYVWKEVQSVFRQQITVPISPDAPANRALWIVLSLWRDNAEGHYRPWSIVESDRRLLNDRQVVLGQLVLPAASSVCPTAWAASFDNGLKLASAEVPASARPGSTISIPFVWCAESAVSDDYIQFLHFVHEDTGEWWGHDQQPLGPRLPTGFWYEDLADSETWKIPLPVDLPAGQYSVYTGLYRLSDLKRLSVHNAVDDAFVDGRVPLGSLMLENP